MFRLLYNATQSSMTPKKDQKTPKKPFKIVLKKTGRGSGGGYLQRILSQHSLFSSCFLMHSIITGNGKATPIIPVSELAANIQSGTVELYRSSRGSAQASL